MIISTNSYQPNFQGKNETSPVNDPLYNTGEFTGLTPVEDSLCHNLDFSGFILVLEAMHSHMEEFDNQLRCQMPYATFQHAMTELLNMHLINIARANGDLHFAYGPEASTVVGSEYLNIPAPIISWNQIYQ